MIQKKTLAGFWSIVFDKANRGIEEKWYIRGGSSSREKICCEVPGCWNFVDRERYFHYTGTAWYFKTFAGSPDWRGKRVLLVFEGWYSQKPLKVYGEWMDEAHEKLPDKPIVLTSHGAGAIYGNRRLEETYWSENYQAKYLKEIGEMLLKRDYISGEIIWHFMDFPVSHWEQLGFTKMLNYLMRPVEFNHKGLVDYYRRPKMSYYVVRDLYKRWQEKEEARNKSQIGGEEA